MPKSFLVRSSTSRRRGSSQRDDVELHTSDNDLHTEYLVPTCRTVGVAATQADCPQSHATGILPIVDMQTANLLKMHFAFDLPNNCQHLSPVTSYAKMMQDVDAVASPLNLVVHRDRPGSPRQTTTPVVVGHAVSPLSGSPGSSPAGASDTGIETGSDVSSACGDDGYSHQFTSFTPSTVVRSTAGYDCLELKREPSLKQVGYRPACDLVEPETSRTMRPQSYRPTTTARSNFQHGVTVGYTYEAFIATDGRSRRRKTAAVLQPPLRAEVAAETARVGGDGALTTPTRSVERGRTTGRYTCSECGRHYATSSNLSRHKQTHRSLDSRYARTCPHCNKPYVSMPALAMHVLTHNLKYRCAVCEKAFSRPWLLRGHQRSHTGEKPFGCAHCGKAFADRSNLRAHIQTHSSTKNYECTRCRRQFALKSYLNKHCSEAGGCAAGTASQVAVDDGHLSARCRTTDDDCSRSTLASSGLDEDFAV